ncbi:MAG: hypothetical protein GY943_26875 [Chloroflexi bacterium]|nr:hypothetical protein [Chloroflexota bacterium]
MRKFSLMLLLLGGLVMIAACSIGGAEADLCDGEGSLLKDDFGGDQLCGWVEYNRSGTVVGINEGVMQISTSQSGQISWTNPGRQLDDVIVSVQARQVSGPDNNAYGVICRYQNEENFYLFLISGDGYYMIGKYQSGNSQIQYLTGEGEFVFSETINQGVATNQIRASCIGDQLSLSVNGIPLISVTDPTFVTGDVGLGASTFVQGTAVVHFDDLLAIAP